MKQHTRIISVLLCIVMIVFVVLSQAFIIAAADHVCTGDDCEICYQIHICEQALKKLSLNVSTASGMLTAEIVFCALLLFLRNFRLGDTLVSKKVKLSC